MPTIPIASRRGFTIIELLVVMTTIGILAGIALPHYRGVVEKADATVIIADANLIAKAAYQYQAENGSVPSSAVFGQAPKELHDLLPAGFVFGHEKLAVYGWYTWQVKRQTASSRDKKESSEEMEVSRSGGQDEYTVETMAGLLVLSQHPALIQALNDQWGGASFGFTNYTILLFEGGA